MIASLIQGRVLSDALSGAVIASPAYEAMRAVDSGPDAGIAVAAFTMNPDGTWSGRCSDRAPILTSGLWYTPTTGAIGAGYEVRITPTYSSGNASVVANDASSWISLSAARTLSLTLQELVPGDISSFYSVLVEIRVAGGGALVSSNSFSASLEAIAVGHGVGDCPALDMWTSLARRVGDLYEDALIDGVHSDDPERLVPLRVLAYRPGTQPCYRIVTRSGAALVASDSTPFTLRDGSSRLISKMNGEDVLRDDGFGGLVWDTVSQCYPVGDRPTAKINVGGHSLLAGENPRMRIVSHNIDKS